MKTKRLMSVIVTTIMLVTLIPVLPASAASPQKLGDVPVYVGMTVNEVRQSRGWEDFSEDEAGPVLGYDSTGTFLYAHDFRSTNEIKEYLSGNDRIVLQEEYGWNKRSLGNGYTTSMTKDEFKKCYKKNLNKDAQFKESGWEVLGGMPSTYADVTMGSFTIRYHWTYDLESWEANTFIEIRAYKSGSSGGNSAIVKNFTDVHTSDYYADAVTWAVDNGVTNGMDATHFGPDLTVTRAQAVTFLWRSKGCPEPRSSYNPFKDVPSGEYYYKSVLWAVEQGITNGTSSTTFSPNDTLTRAHMITFLYRTVGQPGRTGSGEWYSDAERWGKNNGILSGTGSSYRTNDSCPRADVVYYLWKNGIL